MIDSLMLDDMELKQKTAGKCIDIKEKIIKVLVFVSKQVI